MNELIIFGIQLFITLSMSVFIVYLLTPYLKEVLKDTCGTEHSSEFWVRFTQLMMIIAPLVIVIFFSVADAYQLGQAVPAYILKQTILQTLIGEFVGLILVGRIIYRAINTTVEHARADAQLSQLQQTSV
ncbi:MAG: hypothetical protein ACC657_04210 [Thiohalomonadales bacterium]